jgi:hypothetical protein
MFLLGAASSAASVASVFAAVLHVVDGGHRLRPERLIVRSGTGGVNGVISAAGRQVRVGGGSVVVACRLSCVL